MKKISLIGAASGWGAQLKACERGPEALLENGFAARDLHVASSKIIFPQKKARDTNLTWSEALPEIVSFNRELAKLVMSAVDEGNFPLVLGGDHTNAVGTWNGVRRALLKQSPLPLGLLWLDAHMDAHTPETTPSGAWHGMPLAALLGYGDKNLASFLSDEPVLLPDKVCLIGVRSFEEGEAALLKRLNVRIYYMEEIEKRGLQTVMREALALVQKGTCGFGVSLDLDVIDPHEAPGVGSPAARGISMKTLETSLNLLKHNEALQALEIVEYNPERDAQKKTAQLVPRLIEAIL